MQSTPHPQPAVLTMGQIQQQPILIQQPQIVMGPPSAELAESERRRLRWTYRVILWLGVVQIIIGALCVIFQIAAQTENVPALKEAGFGFWCGLFFIMAGLLCVICGYKQNNKGLVIVSLIFTIISSTLALTLLVAASIAAAESEYSGPEYWTDYEWPDHDWRATGTPPPPKKFYRKNENYFIMSVAKGLSGTMIALAIINGILAIIAAAMGCAALYTSTPKYTHTVVFQMAPAQPGGTMVLPVGTGPQSAVVWPANVAPSASAGLPDYSQAEAEKRMGDSSPPPGYSEHRFDLITGQSKEAE